MSQVRREHAGYLNALRADGHEVIVAPGMGRADDVFIRDPVFVTWDEATGERIALRGSMGREPRQHEPGHYARFLADELGLRVIEPPAGVVIEFGDVTTFGLKYYVGQGGGNRTNEAGLRWFTEIVTPLGHMVTPVRVHPGALHKDTAAKEIGRSDRTGQPMVVLNPEWVDRRLWDFTDFLVFEVDSKDPIGKWAANCVRYGDTAFLLKCPGLAERLAGHVRNPLPLAGNEFMKGEGLWSCSCSEVTPREAQCSVGAL